MNRQKLLFPMISLTLITLLATECGPPQAPPTPTDIPAPTNTLAPTATPLPTDTPTPTLTPTPPAPPSVREFRITTDEGIQSQPAICGDHVVFVDFRHDNLEVYAYNLSTEEETRITMEEDFSAFLFPSVAGDLAVWGRDGEFYGYRLDTEDAEEFFVTDFRSLKLGCPAVCGALFSAEGLVLTYGVHPSIDLSERMLVWSNEETEGKRDILAFDLEQDMLINITDDAPSQEWPATAGNLVVWMDERNDGGDIYAYDLGAQEEFPIVTAPLTQTMPSTNGSLVVWIDNRDGNDDLYGYDLETQTEFLIVTGPADRAMPVVQGNFVIWMEDQREDWDIYGYDLLAGEKFPIVTEDGWQGNPRIWGNTVVWTDKRDEDNQDIYGATLEY